MKKVEDNAHFDQDKVKSEIARVSNVVYAYQLVYSLIVPLSTSQF